MRYFLCGLLFMFSVGIAAEDEVALGEEIVELNLTDYSPQVVPQVADISNSPTLKKKSSLIAVGLSSLIPGLGHTYLGEYRTAAEIFGIWGGSLGAALTFQEYSEPSFAALQTTGFYSTYSVYRDVRNYNGQEGYKYKMPQDSFQDLMYAPFNGKVLRKPEVWGGILGAIALGTAVSHLAFKKVDMHVACDSTGPQTVNVLSAFPIGLGEEAYFRGFLQPALSESLTPWGGITASSLLFGAAHIPNAWELSSRRAQLRYYTYGIPLITTLGMYFGWVTHKNNSLKESTAIHAWYDFAVFLSTALASASIGKHEPKYFSYSISF